MLDAATELFLEQGYDRTSLSDIVSRSKGSRSTLYEQFGNKEGLLRAMVEEVTGQIWQVIGDDGEGPFTEAGLVELGMRFTGSALAPRAIAVFRVLAAERERVPEIAELFFERGPRTVERLLADRFRTALPTQSGSGTPEQLGQVFLGALLGVFHAHHVLGLPASEMDIEAHVRITVRVFLDGVGRSVAAPG
jgi:AcrR family transcriptional regulator